MVVEENSVKELPFSPSKKLFVVKQEVGSFKESVQFQCCFLRQTSLTPLILTQTLP